MEQTQGKRLTIAYDAKRAFLNYRGLGNYCRNLFMQMARYYGENSYCLCTPKDKGLYPRLLQPPFERILPVALWKMAPSIWRRYGIPYALKDKYIDIYHGLSQELPEGIEKVGCKTIVTMHDAIFLRYPHLYSPTYRYSFIKRNQSACRRADCIIAISEQTKLDYIRFFNVEPDRIRVVYQGCNDLYWQPVSPAQMATVREKYNLPSDYILSVGALEERKNHLRLIQAVAAGHINLPLVLVGRGKESFKHQLYDTAKQYGVSLFLIENAQTEDLPAIYRQASVFAYISLFEGFGIPILEAARSQTPIVAATGTCFEEIAAEGALYAAPTDIEAIGDALNRTLQDTEKTTERIKLATANTEKFRAENIAYNMMQTYYSLL